MVNEESTMDNFNRTNIETLTNMLEALKAKLSMALKQNEELNQSLY